MDDLPIQVYKTKDLPEAAALIYKKQNLLRIDRQGRICWFIFDNKIECEQLSRDFFFGELIVNARAYYEIVVSLKHKIFSYERT